jgi:hypothetical protein
VAPAWWLAVAALLLVIEYFTGTYRQFPVVYVIPVSLAAWYSGRKPALALAAAMPLAHLVFVLREESSGNMLALAATAVFRGSVIAFMALWFARLSEHERALRHEVQVLKGLLPICSFCKSIRNDAGDWEPLERFISKRSETQFSHGVCPSCQVIHYGDVIGPTPN